MLEEDKEVLGFSLEFTTKTKELTNLQKLLDGTLQDINAITEAIKKLNNLSKGWNLVSSKFEKHGKFDDAKKYKAMAEDAKRIRDVLKLKEKNTSSFSQKLPTTNLTPIQRETIGKMPTVEPTKIPSDVVKIITKTDKSGNTASVNFVTKQITDTVNNIIETTVKETVNSLEKTETQKIIQKSTYDPKTFQGIGNVISTKVDEATKAIVQTTEERIGDILTKRIYKNGKLYRTDSYYKPLKEKITPKIKEESPIDLNIKPESILNEKKTKSSFSKFMGRVKNIITYRLVRVAMSAVGKGIQEGFSLLSTSNSAFKDILIDFKSASTSLSVTISQLLLPAAQVLSTALKDLTNYLINVSNAMALNEAHAKGETEYFKLSQEAIDEYSKSLVNATKSLTAIDKFATLSENKPILGEWVKITDEEIENSKEYSFTIEILKDTINDIAFVFAEIAKFIKNINGLSKEWKDITGIGLLTAISGVLLAFKPVTGVIVTLISMVVALHKLWDSDLPVAIKAITMSLIGVASIMAVIAALAPGGQIKVAAALTAGGMVAAGLAIPSAYQSSTDFVNKNLKTPDTGSSSIENSSLSSYASGLESGKVSDVNTFEPQVTTTVGDVILDGYRVGKYVSQSVLTFGRKNGKI